MTKENTKTPLSEDIISEGFFAKFFTKILLFLNKGKIKELQKRYDNDPRIMKAANEYLDAKDDLELAIKDMEVQLAKSAKTRNTPASQL